MNLFVLEVHTQRLGFYIFRGSCMLESSSNWCWTYHIAAEVHFLHILAVSPLKTIIKTQNWKKNDNVEEIWWCSWGALINADKIQRNMILVIEIWWGSHLNEHCQNTNDTGIWWCSWKYKTHIFSVCFF
jgi:hypothetical protein